MAQLLKSFLGIALLVVITTGLLAQQPENNNFSPLHRNNTIPQYFFGKKVDPALPVFKSLQHNASGEHTDDVTISNTDIPIHPSVTRSQWSSSVAVSTQDPNNLFISLLSFEDNDPPYMCRQGWFFSTDGGRIWNGSEEAPTGLATLLKSDNPVALFNRVGTAYHVSMGNPSGVMVIPTTNFGTTWGSPTNADNTNSDKNYTVHAITDLSENTSQKNNMYVAWQDQSYGSELNYNGNSIQTKNGEIIISTSTNNGITWGYRTGFSTTDVGLYPNIAVGPTGTVYAVWDNFPVNSSNTISYPENGIRFTKSTDGGQTWSSAAIAFSITGIYDPSWNNWYESNPSMGEVHSFNNI